MNTSTYGFKILLGLDMLGSVLIFRDPDVTISSLTGLELRKPVPRMWARVLGKILNTLSKGHCERAISHDIERAKSTIAILS